MATVRLVRRVSNPKRKRYSIKRGTGGRFVRKSKSNVHRPVHKRRTGAVIKRYTVKQLKKELHRRGVKSNPGHKRRKRYTRHRRAVSNPVLIELGAINPKRTNLKRRAKVAAHKRRSKVYRRRRNARAAAPRRRRRYTMHRRRTRTRAVAVNPHRRRRYNRRRSAVVHHRRRRLNRRYTIRHRNPSLFGHRTGKDLLAMTGGILVGVAATKFIPGILPASITSLGGGSPWVGVLITGASAFAAGYAARRFVGEPFGDAVLLGGLAQVASQVLNIVMPTSSLTSYLALGGSGGMGDIIPGQFVVPQNPIRAGMMLQSALPVSKTPPSGVGAFRGAFGMRR